MDRFMYSSKRTLTSFRIFLPNLDFLMLQLILLIILDFSKASYIRIHHFQKYFNWKLFCYGLIYVQWQQEVDMCH